MDHGFFHSSAHNYQQKHQPNKHNNNNITVSNNKDNNNNNNINFSNSKDNNNKKRLTQEQVRLLERTFTTNKKLEPELKLQLANQLGVPPRQVAIWYQNKRARWKTQSLELDHNTLQLRLESAVSDKRRLEKQVLNLQEELRKAQEMLIFFNQQQQGGGGSVVLPDQPNHHHLQYQVVNGSCNSSSDEGAASSSNLQEEVNGEVLQLDELYACLIGGGEGITWC